MIAGIGFDIVDISVMSEKLADDPALAECLFTRTELEYALTKRYPNRHLAARFAAKEALLKALPGPRLPHVPWMEICTENDSEGRPQLRLSGSLAKIAANVPVDSIHLSISHTNSSAAAVVVLETHNLVHDTTSRK